MFKIDLHTHSIGSPDGGLRVKDYTRALVMHKLDCIAVTDHNTIAHGLEIQSLLGDRIIVGEEILTTEGEIIGLYLKQPVAAGLTPLETITAIRAQHGLVYIPHPFETRRKGMSRETLEILKGAIDIVEGYNGRAWAQQRGREAQSWATQHNKVQAASSDAHGWHGWGLTYTSIAALPTKETLVSLLRSATLVTHTSGLRGALYPTLHRTKKRWQHAI